LAKSYVRKVGAEEVRLSRVAVMKSALGFFPPVGTAFDATIDDHPGRLELEAYHCECRGPEKPHEHWFIRWPGLVAGQTVSFVRACDTYSASTTAG
jgi:hypothetical protein